jgi:phosphoribosylformylglycinamidine cyclo-ligase
MPRPGLKPGDLVFGLPSSGAHSNGFSLIRRIVARSGLRWDAPAPFDPSRTLAAALLTPTRLYVRPMLQALKQTRGIYALAHITGGGYPDNLPRALDDGLGVLLDLDAFAPQPVFSWLAEAGDLDEAEMLRTFNCGFGMAAFVSAESEGEARDALAQAGLSPVLIGELVSAEGRGLVTRGRLKL